MLVDIRVMLPIPTRQTSHHTVIKTFFVIRQSVSIQHEKTQHQPLLKRIYAPRQQHGRGRT